MKKNLMLLFVLILILSSIFSGCSLTDKIPFLKKIPFLNKVPIQYTEGIKFDRDYPDDELEIYDDAIVFGSDSRFGEIILSCGTADDFDDIVDFYHDFFEDKKIELIKEQQERDEYYATGKSGEYLFKIQIEEADGEFIEDEFENIIYLSVKKSDSDDKLENTDSSTTTSEITPTATPSTTSAPTPTPEATQQPIEDDTKQITSLESGVWTASFMHDLADVEYTILTVYIKDDTNGTIYYYDYYSDYRWYSDFTYKISNGIITFDLDGEDDPLLFNASFDNNALILENNDYVIPRRQLYNWSDYYNTPLSDDTFASYGSWLFYLPSNSYTETIAFWPGGIGYTNNWDNNGENHQINWTFDDGVITVIDGDNEFVYVFTQRGDVFEINTADRTNRYFYNRIPPVVLAGTYVMDETSSDDITDWALGLSMDYSASYTIDTVTNNSSDWYIDSSSGKMYINIDDQYIAFDYHYDIYGLWLVDDLGDYYRLQAVG
jgi:hypothetical protein